MTRFATKLATVTACSLLVAAPIASAQETEKATAPESYANIAGIQTGESVFPVVEDNKDATGYSAEVSPSLTEPGKNTLPAERLTLPQDSLDFGTDTSDKKYAFHTKEEMDKHLGEHYQLNLGSFDDGKSPFPDGIASTKFSGSTELQDTHVPSASTEGNFALRDLQLKGDAATDQTVLVIQGAKSSVECESKDKQTASTTADKIYVRESDGLQPQLMPTEKPLELKGLSFGAPKDLTVTGTDVDPALTKSDVTISKLTKFDDLIKQKEWRKGDINAAAGWEVKIVTHVFKDAATELRTDDRFVTRYVLGGVSCSLPSDFEPEVVPTAVPAGYASPAAPGESGTSPVGFALLGAGALLAGGAAFVVRRRRHDH
ncbi:LPXTG cell wall anchor domain-containing protein [Amycolatopsis sp. NPDC059657]|uniref:LPXTG cell wall anchor domain-containing protein n=1 Tax=Amycolatopsis sp. NPDC059657 TaxID=3346899 RepID=UPI0036713058